MTEQRALKLAPKGSTTLSFTKIGKEQCQRTKATIGEGAITIEGSVIGGDSKAIQGFNRDLTGRRQEITKDQITSELDSSITIDKRLLTRVGRARIVKDFKDFDKNLGQIAKNLTENNIVVQSIRTALSDSNDYNLFEAAGKYVADTKKGQDVLSKYVEEINGATKLRPEQAQAFLQEMATIYNENGDIFSGLEISNLEGNIAGLSYINKDGNKETIS